MMIAKATDARKWIVLIAAVVAIGLLFFASPLSAAESVKAPNGGFEIFGYFSAGVGWQRFWGGRPTEQTEEVSYSGVLGRVLPNTNEGTLPWQGEDVVEAFIESLEVDITKRFGDRAALRADLMFGRLPSSSWIPTRGLDIEQAYLTVTLSPSHDVQFQVGRFGTPMGFEPFEPYNSDIISWSIISRSMAYPPQVTGAQLSFDVVDGFTIFLAATNGLAVDTTIKASDVPGGYASFLWTWGDEAQQNSLAFSPFFGPDSDSNRHFSMGADATLKLWATTALSLGLEGIFRRDDGYGGPNTNYAGGLFNLRYDFTPRVYGATRLSFMRQFDIGNGVLDLTGDKQNIYEASLATGYRITDGMNLKFEGRFDVIQPSASRSQYVPGVAMGLTADF